jgi:hypothetical protein
VVINRLREKPCRIWVVGAASAATEGMCAGVGRD